MTMPVLMTHLRGKKLQSQFMKAYSELNQASRTFYANEDVPFRDYQETVYSGSWDSSQALSRFMQSFKGTTKTAASRFNSWDSLNKIHNLNLNGSEITQYPCDSSIVITDISGRAYIMDDMAAGYGLDFGPKICVDINGIDKPNKWGYDRFVFVFNNDNAVVPYTGSLWMSLTKQQTSKEEIAKYCNYEQSTPAHTCAYFALMDKAPDGKGSYWTDFLK